MRPDFESGRNGATPMLYDTVAVRGIAKNGPIDKYNATKNASEKIGWIFSSNSFLNPPLMTVPINNVPMARPTPETINPMTAGQS